MQGDDDGDDINVQVSCACCGSVVKESTIEDNDDDKGKDKPDGEPVKPNLLRSKSSSSTRLGSCFGCCGDSASKNDKGVVEKATDVHTTSTSTQELPLT